MSKGTPSRGLHNKGRTHIRCRRCGKRAYHKTKRVCASCGYGNSARRRVPMSLTARMSKKLSRTRRP